MNKIIFLFILFTNFGFGQSGLIEIEIGNDSAKIKM